MDRFIVILGGKCEALPEESEHPCVMGLAGPFNSKQEGAQLFASLREQGFIPHWASPQSADHWMA